MKKGTKVRLTKKAIDWYLDRMVEVHMKPSGTLDDYHEDRAVFLGHISKYFPMTSKVIGKGCDSDTFEVIHHSELGCYHSFYQKKDLIVLKK